MIDPLTVLVLSTSLALLFFTAAMHKLNSSARFRAQLAAYELVPSAILPGLARAIPLAEMAVVFLILVPITRPWAGALAAGLLASYTVAIAVNLLRGRDDIDCGCGGQPQMLSLLAASAECRAHYWLLAFGHTRYWPGSSLGRLYTAHTDDCGAQLCLSAR